MTDKKPGFREKLARSRPYLIVMGLCLSFIIVVLWPRIFISIKPGQAGVLWLRFFGGTVADMPYEEGFHIIAPWDRMEIYDVRIQSAEPEVDVLTKNGLRIRLKLTIRYQPQLDTLGVLHQKVGPRYADTIVVPEVISIIRQTIGNYDSSGLYTTQNAIMSKILNDASEQASHRYVQIDDVIIREILLPEPVRTAIEEKIEQQELARAYEFRLDREKSEAERRKIEAQGYKEANTILSSSLNPDLLKWKGIQATRELATSTNAKVIVIGSGGEGGGLPIILGADR